MRNRSIHSDIRSMLALASFALVATSCSRSLPTAPASSEAVTPRGVSDPFAIQGLENQVVITFAPGSSVSELATEYGASIVTSEAGERTASLRPVGGQTAAELMAQLQLDGRIVTAEPNKWMEPAEARQQSFAFDDGFGSAATFSEQPAALNLHLGRAHEVATGKGVKVAIIDTGADLMHPALRHSIIGGWDFINNDAIAADQKDYQDNDRDGRVDEAFGHGTHVAGIVHLVAPDAQLLIVRVLDADGRGDIVNVAAGVRWAVEQGAKVINLSLGSTERSDALQNVLEDAENAGIVIISTAGNWGSDKLVDFPGKSTHTMCVAAVDNNNSGASFSSYGSEIELSAPGVAVRSPFPGGGYRLWSGTSMSAPFVAGAAALLAQVHPNWSLVETQTRLEDTAASIGSVPAGASKNQFGKGALDVGAALAPDFTLNPVPGVNEDIRPH